MAVGESSGAHERPLSEFRWPVFGHACKSGAAKCAATTRTCRAKTRGRRVEQEAVVHPENLARLLELFR
ncbi:hypothetical protein BST29_05095 [Mycobacterium malmoense]|uniref:Uncharacterized protein n=1 Tax=Mycobacterium malmoense TaxID=1780 RepID=A0ABX3SXF6_MYCMA|nr:hypothetical protein BST29_05095 [Mycobacterium malmoense]